MRCRLAKLAIPACGCHLPTCHAFARPPACLFQAVQLAAPEGGGLAEMVACAPPLTSCRHLSLTPPCRTAWSLSRAMQSRAAMPRPPWTPPSTPGSRHVSSCAWHFSSWLFSITLQTLRCTALHSFLTLPALLTARCDCFRAKQPPPGSLPGTPALLLLLMLTPSGVAVWLLLYRPASESMAPRQRATRRIQP